MKNRQLLLGAALLALASAPANGATSLATPGTTSAEASTTLQEGTRSRGKQAKNQAGAKSGAKSGAKAGVKSGAKTGDGPYGRQSRARNQERRKQQTDKTPTRGQDKPAPQGGGANPQRIKNARQAGGSRINADAKRAREQRVKLAEEGRSDIEKATDEQYQKRLEAARAKNTAEGLSAAEQQKAARVQAARAQQQAKEQRVAGARQQYTEAQRAQRISSARQDLAGLDEGQTRTAKRFLLEQEKHHQRLARIDRVAQLLEGKGDDANMKRVAALRTKELAAFEGFKASMRKSLSERQAKAIESTGEVGTRKGARPDGRKKLMGSSAQKTKAKTQQDAQKREN